MDAVRLTRSALAGLAVVLSTVAVEAQNATNGFFGPGSYLGSDHWFSLTTQGMLESIAREGLGVPAAPGGALDRAARRRGGKPADPWVRPEPDACWKRPVLRSRDGRRKGSGERKDAPADQGGLASRHPGGGSTPPVPGEGFSRPRSDSDWVRPRSDEGYTPPRSDGEWTSPRSERSYRSPRSDGDYRPPRSGGGDPDPQPGRPHGHDAEEPRDLPEGDHRYRRPSSDGDYRPPRLGGTAGLFSSGSEGSESAPAKASPGRLKEAREALARGHRAVLARDITAATREYRAALRFAGKDESALKLDVRQALGTALLARQRLCQAARHLRVVAHRRPSDARAQLLHGVAVLFKGDLKAARKALARASLKATGGLSALFLGVAAEAQEKWEAALEAYRQYTGIAVDPEVREHCKLLASSPGEESVPRRVEKTAGRRCLGTWRIHSSRLFYDRGGGGAVGTGVNRVLEVRADGTWAFGPSTGKWSIGPIQPRDWKRWGVEPYGPTQKIILSGWDGGEAAGPVEESEGGVDFLWVIYRAGPPAAASPGWVHMKLGR